ncbi:MULTISPECIES: DUF934 domain-containing protein [unclassified Aureimonas]|uniref:DUF934 domain-containing protein n=1 Tax=unclassified Aureimonas TaxID=2615206 RepID=UPI0006F2B1CA|nr:MULTISPECIES: DUF934 domain-containing protein [unclassified Aureimonas]KQT65898.1 hypothetical protein ASG62_20425 [Aureimonas sp. Leaf427]KQT73257.1 hypothetical protein ASG54_16905 [Aureimonas sp. Leaf460]
MTLLVTDAGEKADAFVAVEDVADLSLVSGPVLVPLTVIDQAIDDRRNTPLGLSVANDTPVQAISPYFDSVELISIAFPSFSDGRGLSLAKRIRRKGFTGTLRAAGPLIADQFAEALACGFDEVLLPDQMAARQPLPQWMVAKEIVHGQYQSGYGEGESILQKRLKARAG